MSTVPAFLHSLVDDAAIFPPGNAPIDKAVEAHHEHRAAAYADLVGPFVVSDVRLPDLLDVLRSSEQGPPAVQHVESPLRVSLVVTGGAGAIEPAVRWAGAAQLSLGSLEIALRDETDLAHNAKRVTTVVDQLLTDGLVGEETTVFVEPPRLFGAEPSHSWLAALDELASREILLKLRTGGIDADAFPTAREVAAWIDASVERELGFKCTAGLHHALRHRDPDTGFEHHGFLNVLLATRATLDTAPVGDVVQVLEDSDEASVRARLRDVGDGGLESARRWFISFGSCSVLEPLEDLVELDLVPGLPLEPV